MMPEDMDTKRRTVLKLLGATGATAVGAGAMSGAAAAAPGGSGPITQEAGSLTQDVTADIVNDETGKRVGRFTGTLSLDNFSVNDAGDALQTSGTLDGAVKTGSTTQSISQSFSDVTTALSSNGGCTILTLDLGPLDLEVLGLRVQLNRIQLDITGETGAGNLLGNLLCAIADIGSGSGLGGLSGILNDLLGVVNDLLGSLGTQ